MRKLIPIREFLTSPQYAGTADLMGGASWSAWRTLLIAAMGEPLEPDELVVFRELTGRVASPVEPVREFFSVMGRRAGKSRAVAVLAAYTASCIDLLGIAPACGVVFQKSIGDVAERLAAVTFGPCGLTGFNRITPIGELSAHRRGDLPRLGERHRIDGPEPGFALPRLCGDGVNAANPHEGPALGTALIDLEIEPAAVGMRAGLASVATVRADNRLIFLTTIFCPPNIRVLITILVQDMVSGNRRQGRTRR